MTRAKVPISFKVENTRIVTRRGDESGNVEITWSTIPELKNGHAINDLVIESDSRFTIILNDNTKDESIFLDGKWTTILNLGKEKLPFTIHGLPKKVYDIHGVKNK